MTLSWTQSGTVDNYAVASNNTVTSSANFSGVGEGDVSVTVSSLPTSGAYYCITVTAVSGHLDSDSVTQCNYTGEQFVVVLLQFFLTLVVYSRKETMSRSHGWLTVGHDVFSREQ